MVDRFKLECMKLAKLQRAQFREVLRYVIKQKKPLKYDVFSRFCGISRQQWDKFRSENREVNIKWMV